MTPQTRRTAPAKPVRLGCLQLESRLAPAVFSPAPVVIAPAAVTPFAPETLLGAVSPTAAAPVATQEAPVVAGAAPAADPQAVVADPAVTLKFGDDVGYLFGDYLSRAGRGAFVMSADQPNKGILQVTGGRLLLEMVATEGVSADELGARLGGLGAETVGSFGRVVDVWLPVAQLGAAADLPGLRFGFPAYKPRTNAGKVDNQAVPAMKSDVGSARYGVTGAGVTVGVMSDSFNALNGYAADVASGDLPGGVSVVADSTGSDEGRAMAQLIYDVAPGVGLAFASANGGEATFASRMKALAKPVAAGGTVGAKVVVDDIGYFHEPFFQDGLVAQAADDINSLYGVPEFSSAGNSGRDAYQSAFNPFSGTTTGGGAGTYHNFNPSGTATALMPFTVPRQTSFTVILQWDQPFASESTGSPGTNGSTNSVGLYVLNASQAVLGSATTNVVGGDPYRVVQVTNSSTSAATMYVAMKLTNGSAPGLLKFSYDGGTPTAYATNTGTLSGHPMAAGAAGVAAAWGYNTPGNGAAATIAEDFTSAGGSPILFDKAGNRIAGTTGETRQQPRVTAPDGTDTTFFAQSDQYTNGYAFFGTSAAAPHAAAVAALIRQLKPSLTPADIYAVMQSTALDVTLKESGSGTVATGSGFDFDTGYGLVQADKALAAVSNVSVSGRVFRDYANDGTFNGADVGQSGVSVFLDSDNDGVRDVNAAGATASTNTQVNITDPSGGFASRVTSPVTVGGQTGRVTKATVKITSLTHTYHADLLVTLVSPKGMRVPLWTFFSGTAGSSAGAAFTNTVFDDQASASIKGSALPHTGSFKPVGLLSSVAGEDPNGTWQLEVRDTAAGDTGTLNSWSITLFTAEPDTATAADGTYSFTGLAPSSYYGTYSVREAVPTPFTQTSPNPASSPLTLTNNAATAGFNLGNYYPLTTVASVVPDSGTGQASSLRKVTVTLNGTVTAANVAAGAFAVAPTTGSNTYGVTVQSATASGSQTVVVLTFTATGATPALIGGSLPDGRYTLTINGAGIVDVSGAGADAAGSVAPGTTTTRSLQRLFGDSNGDGDVDNGDLLQFRIAFGSISADSNYNAAFDYNNDGDVDNGDLLQFRQRFNTLLP